MTSILVHSILIYVFPTVYPRWERIFRGQFHTGSSSRGQGIEPCYRQNSSDPSQRPATTSREQYARSDVPWSENCAVPRAFGWVNDEGSFVFEMWPEGLFKDIRHNGPCLYCLVKTVPLYQQSKQCRVFLIFDELVHKDDHKKKSWIIGLYNKGLYNKGQLFKHFWII